MKNAVVWHIEQLWPIMNQYWAFSQQASSITTAVNVTVQSIHPFL